MYDRERVILIKQPYGAVVPSGLTADSAWLSSSGTDNGPFIQAAFNGGAKVVFIPPGHYRVHTKVVIPAGGRVVGAAEDVTVINCTSTTDVAFERVGANSDDAINGCHIEQIRFFGIGSGSNNAYGAVRIQDAFRSTFEKCTFWGFWSGRGTVLRNHIVYTEGTRFNNCMWRNCLNSVLFYITGSSGAQASFAETCFTDCTFDQTINGGSVIKAISDTSVRAYIYYSKFDWKVNMGAGAGTKASIFDFSQGGVRCTFNRYAIGTECFGNRAYWRFNCGPDTIVDGIGFITTAPSDNSNGEQMSRFTTDTHPYDTIHASSMVYLSPAGLFSPSNGQFGADDPAQVHCGAGVPDGLARKQTTNTAEPIVYMTEGVYEISVQCKEGSNFQSAQLIATCRRGSATTDFDGDLVHVSGHHNGSTLIDGNQPFRLLNTIQNNSVLYINFINISSSMELDVTVTQKTYYKSPGGSDTDFGPFKPFVIFPSPSEYTLGSNTVNVRYAAPRRNYAASADPTVNDDSRDGYSAGSEWYRTSTQKLWKCTDPTAGAAVWVLLN